MKDLTQVLLRPIITEKTTMLGEAKNKYAFEVARTSTKPEIRQAVEKYFGVKVLDIKTARVKGKPKRMGRFEGKRADWKKAIVTLAAEDKIDLFDVV